MKNRFASALAIFVTITAPRAAFLISPVQSVLAALTAAWAKHRQHMRDLHALLAMSDRDLWDIGLTQDDVGAVMKGQDPRH